MLMSQKLKHWTALPCPSVPLRDTQVTYSSSIVKKSEAMRYLDSGSNSLGVVGSPCLPQVGAGWILSELSSKCAVLNLEHGCWRKSVNLKQQVCSSVKQDQTRLRAAKSPQVSAEPLWMRHTRGKAVLLPCVTGFLCDIYEFRVQLAGSGWESLGQGKQAPSSSLPVTRKSQKAGRVVTPSACRE